MRAPLLLLLAPSVAFAMAPESGDVTRHAALNGLPQVLAALPLTDAALSTSAIGSAARESADCSSAAVGSGRPGAT